MTAYTRIRRLIPSFVLFASLVTVLSSPSIVSAFHSDTPIRDRIVVRIMPLRSTSTDDANATWFMNDPVSRRSSFQKILKVLAIGAVLEMSIPQNSDAAWGKDRRQLEFCLVNLLRVSYWAESVARDLKTIEQEERRKELYLEARLGAKAIVTGRVGGGATSRVYTLATLQFRGCLQDLTYYGKSRQVSDLAQDLLEAVAAVVEFDGLETTTDPSPRSSLTLSMYNSEKVTYVQRLLSERVVPLATSLANSFEPEVRNQCKAYIASTYPNEVPKLEVTGSAE